MEGIFGQQGITKKSWEIQIKLRGYVNVVYTPSLTYFWALSLSVTTSLCLNSVIFI